MTCFSPYEHFSTNNKNRLDVNLIKLHGTLNAGNMSTIEEFTTVVDDPKIIPPIANKSSNDDIAMVWSSAIKYLRQAKNIVFVGYSLPQTDLYMQYFLRSGIGPNTNLNKITVFDPVLWTDSMDNEYMRKRFNTIFSSQIRNRIEFNPKPYTNTANEPKSGTMEHFVHQLYDSAHEGYDGLLF